MKQILIVEDQPGDLKVAADILTAIEAAEIEARSSASAARLYLDAALEGKHPLPDLIILDLDLGYESGYELLRFWHRDARLSGIKVVVWTGLGKEQQEMCNFFGVNGIVAKWEGAAALKRTIEGLAVSA